MKSSNLETDRELLEMAAKAAGLGTLVWGEKYKLGDDEIDCTDLPYVRSGQPDEGDVYWNPLTDDGDALRLAVKLGLDVCIDSRHENKPRTLVIGFSDDNTPKTVDAIEYHGDPYAATRRAIVRAAAEIGKKLV